MSLAGRDVWVGLFLGMEIYGNRERKSGGDYEGTGGVSASRLAGVGMGGLERPEPGWVSVGMQNVLCTLARGQAVLPS